jgi:hypothetical protein
LALTNCFAFCLSAQQFKNNVGAPYIGLSAYSTKFMDVFGYHTNTAALGELKTSAIGVFGERRFGVQELNNFSAHTALATKAGGIGLQANRFGFSGFNETQIGIGYGKQLSDKITIGAKANYYQQQIAGYGNASTVNAEAGILLHLTPKLTSGISVFNPIGGKFGINKTEKLASFYKLGLGYDISDKVNIVTELIKQDNSPINFIGAVHYQFEKKFFAKVGVSSAASNFFAAVGINLNNQFRMDVFASHHQQLGFSPGVMLLFTPKAKETK